MKFIIEFWPYNGGILHVLPWRLMVQKESDYPAEEGYKFQDVIDHLADYISDEEAQKTWPRLKQVFNKQAVDSLQKSQDNFQVYVDTEKGSVFVKRWGLIESQPKDVKQAMKVWLKEYE